MHNTGMTHSTRNAKIMTEALSPNWLSPRRRPRIPCL